MRKFWGLILCSVVVFGCQPQSGEQWSVEQANAWYQQQGWLRGCNFTPSSAINQLEMWQAESFDSETIDRELAWAEDIGFNCMRVFLHHLAWEIDPKGFKNRMDQYLQIADRHGIKTMFVFFDDCWNGTYQAGKQPDPQPGVHNSGWLKDPGELLFENPEVVQLLEAYMTDILKTFKKDKRVLLWDLYNEPGNGYEIRSLPLLEKVFVWARTVNPSQPISVALWRKKFTEMNQLQLANSDIITYHTYNPPPSHQKAIDSLKRYGRPVICTEYMMRPNLSTFQDIMPLLKEANFGAINWGFVAGKTNTIFAWGKPEPDIAEPALWFHDILRRDGSPFDQAEIDFIKKMCR